MTILKRFDRDNDLERSLDRRFEQEPTYGKRQRIALNEEGALKTHFTKPVIIQAEKAWRPSDTEVAA